MGMVRVTERFTGGIEQADFLDGAAEALSGAVTAVVPRSTTRKDILSGTWLGHPLHPLLTDVVIGSWTSAWLLDMVGGESGERAADLLVAVGVASAVPTAASGLSDWSDLLGPDRRTGLVHAAANTAALAFYTASMVARLRGRRRQGVMLGMLGATAATAGGFLGGHLSYRRGVNVDRNAWFLGPDDWVEVAQEADLEEGKPTKVTAGGVDVLLVRHRTRVCAIGNVCGHAGAPLDEGSFEAGSVTCPWHGSVFDVADGAVVHGPATGPQPAYDVRSLGGTVSVKRRS